MHQKAARSIGMRTVWMQRWARKAARLQSRHGAARVRPPYVDRRVTRLRELLRGAT